MSALSVLHRGMLNTQPGPTELYGTRTHLPRSVGGCVLGKRKTWWIPIRWCHQSLQNLHWNIALITPNHDFEGSLFMTFCDTRGLGLTWKLHTFFEWLGPGSSALRRQTPSDQTRSETHQSPLRLKSETSEEFKPTTASLRTLRVKLFHLMYCLIRHIHADIRSYSPQKRFLIFQMRHSQDAKRHRLYGLKHCNSSSVFISGIVLLKLLPAHAELQVAKYQCLFVRCCCELCNKTHAVKKGQTSYSLDLNPHPEPPVTMTNKWRFTGIPY